MYENRTIFASLDKAWDLLSLFQKDKLARISNKIKDEFYMRANREFEQERNQIVENRIEKDKK